MSDCIFCKIIANKIPAHKIFENETTLAFLDISPVTPGHVLVIPKKHFSTLDETPSSDLSAVMDTVQSIIRAIKQCNGAKGCNVMINNRSAAGQIVMHTHVHVIPRYENDGLMLWQGKKYETGQAEELSRLIKSKM